MPRRCTPVFRQPAEIRAIIGDSTIEGRLRRRRGGLFGRFCRLCFFDLLQDLPPQPRRELLHDLLVRRGQPAGSRGGAASLALCSTSFIMSISILVARRSALADLSTICVTIASRLVIVRRCPSIVTTTVSFSASASNAGRLLVLRPRQRLTFEAPERPFYIGVRADNPNAADIRSRA